MFGIDEGKTESFLSQRGFRHVESVELPELKHRYFTGKNAKRVLPTGIAIASAQVNKAV